MFADPFPPHHAAGSDETTILLGPGLRHRVGVGAERCIAIARGRADRLGIRHERLLDRHDTRLATSGTHRTKLCCDRGQGIRPVLDDRPGKTMHIVRHQ